MFYHNLFIRVLPDYLTWSAEVIDFARVFPGSGALSGPDSPHGRTVSDAPK
jgi:hypothetical protein